MAMGYGGKSRSVIKSAICSIVTALSRQENPGFDRERDVV
jgi:hypothetical protein